MRRYWFTSDTHFGHTNIIGYCLRGYGSRADRERLVAQGDNRLLFKDVDEMNYVMRERWNSVVAPNDVVYFLGDFAMGNPSKWANYLAQLNGEIHLVEGNHDEENPKDEKPQVKQEILDAGFASVQKELYVEVDGYKLWLAHYPYGVDNDKRAFKRPKQTQDVDYRLCGHVHDKWVLNDGGCINVGCDNFEYYPQSIDALLARAAREEPFDSSIFLPV